MLPLGHPRDGSDPVYRFVLYAPSRAQVQARRRQEKELGGETKRDSSISRVGMSVSCGFMVLLTAPAFCKPNIRFANVDEWAVIGNGNNQQYFSPLAQINDKNVRTLLERERRIDGKSHVRHHTIERLPNQMYLRTRQENKHLRGTRKVELRGLWGTSQTRCR